MKTYLVLTCGLAMTALATTSSVAGMPNMPGMPNAASTAKTGKGVGVITALDPKAAKITIKHGPIPSVGWPAMTMTFKATPPKLLTGLHVGQTVGFDVRTKGADAEVTALQGR